MENKKRKRAREKANRLLDAQDNIGATSIQEIKMDAPAQVGTGFVTGFLLTTNPPKTGGFTVMLIFQHSFKSYTLAKFTFENVTFC